MRISVLLPVSSLFIVRCFGPVFANERDAWTAVTNFGFNLLKNTSTESGQNVLVSPLAIHTSLAIVLLGAVGDTRKTLLKVLHLPTTFQTDVAELTAHFVAKCSGSEDRASSSRSAGLLSDTVCLEQVPTAAGGSQVDMQSRKTQQAPKTPKPSYAATTNLSRAGILHSLDAEEKLNSPSNNTLSIKPKGASKGTLSSENRNPNDNTYYPLYEPEGSFYDLPKTQNYEGQKLDSESSGISRSLESAVYHYEEIDTPRASERKPHAINRDNFRSDIRFRNPEDSRRFPSNEQVDVDNPVVLRMENEPAYHELKVPSGFAYRDDSTLHRPVRPDRHPGLLGSTNFRSPLPEWGKSLPATIQPVTEATLANRFYVNDTIAVRPQFVDDVRNVCRAVVTKINFYQFEQARQLINTVTARETGNRTVGILKKPLALSTTSVLVNALHFKGFWSDPVRKISLQKVFNPLCGDRKQMNSRWFQISTVLLYLNSAELGTRLFRIGYRSGKIVYSLLVIVPHRKYSCKLDSWLSKFNQWSDLQQKISTMAETNVDLTFPEFSAESAVDLFETLEQMGMRNVFAAGNFSTMTMSRSMKLNHVVHKTRLSFTETGTNAVDLWPAAQPTSSATREARPRNKNITMALDRPFLIVILAKDPSSEIELPLFMGAINHI